MEIIIKKGEGYLRRQSECSKKERRMDCDEVQRRTEVTASRQLKMRGCNERVASLVQGFDY